ncbi:hypothetical protein YC2023_037468 [Brassica napus]
MVRSWQYIHDDIYDNLSLAVYRLTLHPWQLTSGSSEHCPHRSFAQPSQSKKSDRNQKYVDDSSPETRSVSSLSTNLGGLLLGVDLHPLSRLIMKMN